jgi:predicted MFS family arabinose efflux permease
VYPAVSFSSFQLPEIAADFDVSLAQVGLFITVFALGTIIGAPFMAMATLRLPRRLTLVLALLVFTAGHVVAALGGSFEMALIARTGPHSRPVPSGQSRPSWRPRRTIFRP